MNNTKAVCDCRALRDLSQSTPTLVPLSAIASVVLLSGMARLALVLANTLPEADLEEYNHYRCNSRCDRICDVVSRWISTPPTNDGGHQHRVERCHDDQKMRTTMMMPLLVVSIC
jgi:hypothetical protein